MDIKARIRELTAGGMRISEAGRQTHREAQQLTNAREAQMRAAAEAREAR
jgi:hypothetical protein